MNDLKYQSGGIEQGQAKLPADPSSLNLAIISTIVLVICCCCGNNYLAFILSAIGLVLAHLSVKKYENESFGYSADSYRRVKTARIFNLVVACISLFFLVIGRSGLLGYEHYINGIEAERIFEEFLEREIQQENDKSNNTISRETSEIDEWEYQEEVVEEANTTQTDTLIN